MDFFFSLHAGSGAMEAQLKGESEGCAYFSRSLLSGIGLFYEGWGAGQTASLGMFIHAIYFVVTLVSAVSMRFGGEYRRVKGERGGERQREVVCDTCPNAFQGSMGGREGLGGEGERDRGVDTCLIRFSDHIGEEVRGRTGSHTHTHTHARTHTGRSQPEIRLPALGIAPCLARVRF